ncbi:MAG: hypothetical protein WAO69_03940 [Aestuariivita sp.]
MKSIWMAMAATVVVSVGAWVVLGELGQTSAQQVTGASVRLD